VTAPPGLDFRRESARMLAALTRILGMHNLALAEDVVQDVLCRALEVWKYHAPPDNPTAWLLKAARNRAIDLIRAEGTRRKFAPDLQLGSEWTLAPTVTALFGESEIEDDLLRMMFSCCSPNLAPQAQMALVLKLLCGFGTGEIAAALLTSEAAVEKQIARGKRALMRAGALYQVEGRAQIEKRLEAVQHALYLLFSEGYHGSRELVRAELCVEAMRLCFLLTEHPACKTPRTFALAALMCFHAARLEGRAAGDGTLLLLGEQDRSRWDRRLIQRGFDLLDRSAEGDRITDYHLEAGIASEHCAAPSLRETNWQRILQLYDLLLALRPSPVVALNRAIAIGEVRGPEEALAALPQELPGYPFLAGAAGRFHLKAGRRAEAARSFAQAKALARNAAEEKLFDGLARDAQG
jgi:RNA polymerase sigma-70 factor (ECF subfamily)